MTHTTPLPYSTQELEGIGGALKTTPDDFRVDEIPAYEPVGAGEHTFLHIRKTGVDTHHAVRTIAKHLGVHPDAMGWAGLKDKHAVTTQWLSVPNVEPDAARQLSLENIVVLDAVRHTNKLRTGHLKANRFQIRVRGVRADAQKRAQAIVDRLAHAGVPNYYGEQRFGRDAHNVTRARAWISGSGASSNGDSADTRSPTSKFERKLLFSAFQSHLFNRVLAHRLTSGLFATALAGDLMRKEDTGGLFIADDLADAQSRMNEWLISPTGPMLGANMREPEGACLDMESQILSDENVSKSELAPFARYGEGTRRALRIRPADFVVEQNDDWLWASFVLPKGSYATVVLRELMKNDAQPAADVAIRA